MLRTVVARSAIRVEEKCAGVPSSSLGSAAFATGAAEGRTGAAERSRLSDSRSNDTALPDIAKAGWRSILDSKASQAQTAKRPKNFRLGRSLPGQPPNRNSAYLMRGNSQTFAIERRKTVFTTNDLSID
jgi:hypothetical protein